MKVKEIRAKSILNRSQIGDYTVNPYVGCQHACRYCYAEHYTRRIYNLDFPWGSYVFVKTNAPFLLSREITRKKKGYVYLSSLTDPYQPIEKRYELTRKILSILLKNKWPVIIQTKSSLVLRDLDLLKKFEDIVVGMSITTLNEELRKVVEPFSSPIDERLRTLKKLKKEGIRTFLFIGPLLVPLTEIEEVEKLIKWGIENCEKVYIDRFRIKNDLFEKWSSFVRENFPEKFKIWKNVVKESFWTNMKKSLKKKFDNQIEVVF